MSFDAQLLEYKQRIDADIENYAKQMNKSVLSTYGEHSAAVSAAYTDLLRRGGKRIRGALTLVGYQMCGGTDQDMIIKAARAIEMMHAYILIIDDIQDRSDLRRGGPSAHRLLQARHTEQKWHGDAAHTGVSLALNAALLGSHSASLVLGTLNVPEELRLKALSLMNHTVNVTVHGQTNDIVNEAIPHVTDVMIDNVLQWKTAHYTFLNPIHMGMVLAGAPCEDTNAITQYALHAGKAFQISDDLLVMSSKSDKNTIDDIREGKQTILTVYALQHASKSDKLFLKECLGKLDLTNAEFEQCRTILTSSGAVDHAKKAARQHVLSARKSLREHSTRWNPESVEFLDNLVQKFN